MARLNPNLETILRSYEINPREAVWDCHGTLVILHKFCEVIAAKADIRFDPPIPLEANGANKSVALCVVGRMGERAEWSTGEASPANNKNAYPYAMAEKRAKDRVILKLVGLAQYVHSEDEADEFKDRKPVETAPETKPAAKDYEFGLAEKLVKCASLEALDTLWREEGAKVRAFTGDDYKRLVKMFSDRKAEINGMNEHTALGAA